jgi:cellulose synthase/poly-beta-1,6-N-acetylglucosamine synthase-like glycosyltransferase
LPNHITFVVGENAGPACSSTQPAPELAVLVPTRNEAANIEELLRRLSAAVTGIPTEIVFVDDSDTEIPYTFARRHAGESKGTLREGLTYLGSLATLRLGGGA